MWRRSGRSTIVTGDVDGAPHFRLHRRIRANVPLHISLGNERIVLCCATRYDPFRFT